MAWIPSTKAAGAEAIVRKCRLLLMRVVLAGIFLFISPYASAVTTDSFCVNPAQSICSKEVVTDPTGETIVNSSKAKMLKRLKLRIQGEIAQKFKAALPPRARGRALQRYRELLGLKNFDSEGRPCDSQPIQCENETAEAFSKLFVDEEGLYSGSLRSVLARKSQSLKQQRELVGDPAYLASSAYAESRYYQLIAPAGAEASARVAFTRLKLLFSDKLRTWPINAEDKAGMLKKVGAIRWAGQQHCSEQIGAGGESAYVQNTYYDPKLNDVHVCNGIYLTSSSTLNYAFLIAHELGHSVDPCNYATEFRTDGVNLDRDLIGRPTGAKFISCLNQNAHGFPESEICKDRPGDQIRERFADWVATELLHAYIQKFHSDFNAEEKRSAYGAGLSSVCSYKGAEGDYHVSTAERYNQIIFKNPEVSEETLCGGTKNKSYCQIDVPNAPDMFLDKMRTALKFLNYFNRSSCAR